MAVSLNSAFSFNTYETPCKDLSIKLSSLDSFSSPFRRKFTERKPSKFYCSAASDVDKFAGETETKTTNQQSFPSPSEMNAGQNNSPSETSGLVPETPKKPATRTPLTARERLRAARVLSRYTEPKPPVSKSGNRLPELLQESDKSKKRSGLPQAPSDLLDDSNRGLSKQGWTIDIFPGGMDVAVIIFSFVFISSLMFATTYVVWKSGAIHFNEY